MREHVLGEAERREQIEVHGAPDRVERFVLGALLGEHAARAVDQDLRWAEQFDHGRYDGADLIDIRQVARDRDASDPLGELFEAIFSPGYHATRAPSDARVSATVAPRPDDAPVTIATRPSRPNIRAAVSRFNATGSLLG